MQPWISFLSEYSISNWFILSVLRDQWELGYEYQSRRAELALASYGHGLWITVNPFLPDPLPDWAITQIVAEGQHRFPRFTFGHEVFQLIQVATTPGYVDIRYRAQIQYLFSSTERQERIRAGFTRYRWFP